MASLLKGCVNLFCSQVGRDKLSLFELNKGTLVYNQAERHGPLRQAIKYDYNNKSNKKQVKETVSHVESKLASPCNNRRGRWPPCPQENSEREFSSSPALEWSGLPAPSQKQQKANQRNSFFFATPSSILAWRIPWTEEPGGVQSMGTRLTD